MTPFLFFLCGIQLRHLFYVGLNGENLLHFVVNRFTIGLQFFSFHQAHAERELIDESFFKASASNAFFAPQSITGSGFCKPLEFITLCLKLRLI